MSEAGTEIVMNVPGDAGAFLIERPRAFEAQADHVAPCGKKEAENRGGNQGPEPLVGARWAGSMFHVDPLRST